MPITRNASSSSADRPRPAVFWDRDGTLIEDRGHLADPKDVIFYPGTYDALRRLKDLFMFFIVTHQPGVAEGAITIDQVQRVYVRTGHGLKHLDQLHGCSAIVADVQAAAEWILSRQPSVSR
ncbi:MAG TPA: hypothetical protein VJL29_14250 [Thermoguttaceae bacterium]|nr:hypothetical protein [Thermoguttaceae bacterium]